MGITHPAARPRSGRADAFVNAGLYVVLFLLGAVEGLFGSFQYSRGVLGGVPVAAIGFCLAIFVTCGVTGWAAGGLLGALLPAIGWFVASFGLAMPNSGGSVIIANTAAGEWYIYGGSVAALLGVGSSFVTATRRPPGEARGPGEGARGPGGGRNGSGA